MKIYSMAAVTDCGEYYQVEYLTSSYSKDFETNEKFLGLSLYAASEIKKALDDKKIVRIIKDYNNIDVQPHDLIIVDTTITDLESQKLVYTQKIRQLVTHQQANVSGLMIYEYIHINNYLCDKGFFIHDDNREEIYLDILETEDEEIIDKLEIYLNAKDYISRASFLEKKYFTFYNDIKNADTLEDIMKLYSSFIDMIHSNTY